MVGLFFFIRASSKERSQAVKLTAERSEELLLTQLQQYFEQRSYRLVGVNDKTQQITFEGFVRPSWLLAILLTVLAACGLLCLGLVLSVVFSQIGAVFLGLVLLAPVAGIFYWQSAGRVEQVSFKVETLPSRESSDRHLITVTAHRDELAILQQSLQLKTLPV